MRGVARCACARTDDRVMRAGRPSPTLVVAPPGGGGAHGRAAADTWTIALPSWQENERRLVQLRAEEGEQIAALDTLAIAPGDLWYLITSEWLKQWSEFKRGGPRPGLVDNTLLLDAQGAPLPGMLKGASGRREHRGRRGP